MSCFIKSCDQKATKYFSPDLDIQGIGTCEAHELDIMIAYMALMRGDRKSFNELIEK